MFRFRERCQILFSEPISLLATGPLAVTIPESKGFAVDEVGLVVVALTGAIILQPSVSFGFVGSPAALKATALTTALTAVDKRERYQTLLLDDVLPTLAADITAAATGPSVYTARFYFRGILY